MGPKNQNKTELNGIEESSFLEQNRSCSVRTAWHCLTVGAHSNVLSRNYVDDAKNDHRDITFPHAESPSDDDENDVNGEIVDEDDDVSQNKLTHTKTGQSNCRKDCSTDLVHWAECLYVAGNRPEETGSKPKKKISK